MRKFLQQLNPKIYLSDNYIVFDFETTNRDKGSALNKDNRALIVGVEYGRDHPLHSKGSWCTDLSYDGVSQRLIDSIMSADFIVAHNAKFEAQWLKRLGVDLRKLPAVYDTMLGEYVLAGNRGWKLSLEETSTRYGLPGKKSFVSQLIGMGVCPSTIPRNPLIEYALQDVKVTHEVFQRQRAALLRDGLLNVFRCRCLIVPVLADIEFNGVKLDERRVSESFEDISARYGEATTRLEALAPGVNFRSGPQLRTLLYDVLHFKCLRGPGGKPKVTSGGNLPVDSETIEALKAETAAQRAFKVAWADLAKVKQLEQIIQKLATCVQEDGGILYASFNQSRTQTHRLSSTGGKYKIQFQNFPRSFKRLFRARSSDFLVFEGDAPQLEFRVASELGDDKKAIKAICLGVDVHQLTQKVMEVSRQDAKPHTFKPLYGGSSGTPKERAYYSAFREEYPDIYKEQSGWVNNVLVSGHLRTASGLIFYWEDTKITPSGYITNTPSIFNYPVQSFATADIIPLCLWLIWVQIGEMKSFLVNTIHDSIIAEVHKEEVELFQKIVVQAFTELIYECIELLYSIKIKVPLGVGMKCGEFWGEGEEVKVEPTWARAYGESI